MLTLTERQEAYGQQVAERLRQAGFRAELDDRNEKLGYKIREAQLEKVPYMLVVGDKEAANGTVAPRSRSGGSADPVPFETFHRAPARRGPHPQRRNHPTLQRLNPPVR